MAYVAKTRETDADVGAFLGAVEPPARRDDARALCAVMAEASGVAPRMWGPSIIGFGVKRYAYESGHSGEISRIGFSPRKAALTLYLPDFPGRAEVLGRLGKHTTSKGCIYVKRLSDVDQGVLRELVSRAWAAED